MAKTANLYARIEPELKDEAEMILSALGIPASNAITMFYKQIIFQNGLPFDVKIPAHPLDMSKMSDEELMADIERSRINFEKGEFSTADEAFARIRKDLGI
ncbi:MAG: type II toxin-antitoxin system RelB/DinJ family antitoxin [Clostridia bacterium]